VSREPFLLNRGRDTGRIDGKGRVHQRLLLPSSINWKLLRDATGYTVGLVLGRSEVSLYRLSRALSIRSTLKIEDIDQKPSLVDLALMPNGDLLVTGEFREEQPRVVRVTRGNKIRWSWNR